MDWHPNEDAILYFSDAILPRIRAQVPDVTVTVVGRNPSAHLRAVAERVGIVVTGTVDDVRPYIDEAAVYIVPLRAGGGTRLKIFEALAMGKAVVSTTVGAEGLALTPDRDVCIADEPDEFARAVIASCSTNPARRQRARAGRSPAGRRPGIPGSRLPVILTSAARLSSTRQPRTRGDRSAQSYRSRHSTSL